MTIGKMFAKKRGFTLVELMIVVVIIGILASLAIYGVQKYVRNSKTGEARTNLGAIKRGAISAYQGETMDGSLLAIAGTVGSSRRICASATAPVPALLSDVAGKKYQSGESMWATGSQTEGWTCLRFALVGPQYYMYGYDAKSSSNAAAGDGFTAYAAGDLDSDTVPSSFSISGVIDADGQTLRTSPTVAEVNPEE